LVGGTLPKIATWINRIKSFKQKTKELCTIDNPFFYWDQKRIDLFCYCIMSNRVHAVFQVFEKDEHGSA